MIQVKLVNLPYYQKSKMEDYIENKISGLESPIDMLGTIIERFNIVEIKWILPKSKETTTTIKPVKGGFIIRTPIPYKKKEKALRFVLAHEYAHTFFYQNSQPDNIPRHNPDPYEEALCDYGARAILIPRSIISSIPIEKLSIKDFLKLSETLNILPQWLIHRITMDLHMIDLGFFIYKQQNDKKKKEKQVCTLDICSSREMFTSLRNLIDETSDKNYRIFKKHWIGTTKMGGIFDIEILEEKIGLFSKKFYVLLKTAK